VAKQYEQTGDSRSAAVLIGVDWPKPVSLSAIRRSLQRVKRGHYAHAHACFSEDLANLLAEMGMKSLFILRDPRDVVVSHANYVASKSDHFLFEFYQTLSESERIMKSIIGVDQTAPDKPMLLNIHERCQSILRWASASFSYTTYFEKLVGPPGGGSRDAQVEELNNIARHLGIRYRPHDLEQIAGQIFGGTSTFRKGIIGNWRNHLSEENKRAFKEVAGQMLIDLGYEQDCEW